jgi:hypothetical protein
MLWQWSHHGLRLPVILELYLLFWVFITGFVAGLGLWEAIASLPLVAALLPYNEKCYFVLSPGRAAIVSRVSQLFLSYSIVFAVEVLPFALGFLIFSHSIPTLATRGYMEPNHFALNLSAIVIFFLFVVFMPSYFLAPQWIIARRIKEAKAKLLESYQARINSLLSDAGAGWTEKRMQEYQVFSSVEQTLANSSTIPIGPLDMAKPFFTLLPSIASVLANDTFLKILKQVSKGVLSWL